MDHERFDTLARPVFTDMRRSRRAAIAGLLGAALLRHDPGAALARKGKDKARVAAEADACFPGTNCTPGRGKNTSKCDFALSPVFRNKDVRGANLSKSSFFGADLTGADFRGANLSGACFVGTDLTGAKLGPSVNLHKAVFCNTRMSDGRIDDRGCEGETACCHQRLQDCPDSFIDCNVPLPDGACNTFVSTLGQFGHCYTFPLCCPCADAGREHWTDLCNQTFSGCNGQCKAYERGGTFLSCFDACVQTP